MTISHTAVEGTVLEGTVRGDGTCEVTTGVRKAVGHWRWARSLGMWIVVSSRDRQPKQFAIDAAAKALREAGFDVEIEIDRTARPPLLAEGDRAARQADRVQALQDKAIRKDAKAVAADSAHERAYQALPPGGEPVKIGHHSERRHRRAIEKSWDAWDRSVQAGRDADHAHVRADAAARTTDHRYAPRTVANRIEALEAEQRGDQRTLDGHTRVISRTADGEVQYAETHSPATGEYRQRVIDRMAQRAGEIAYWNQVRDQQIADGLTPGWGPADFSVGDFVRVGGRAWRQVTRVNTKSVSVANIPQQRTPLHTILGKQTCHREVTTDYTVRYHEITAVMTEPEARDRFPDVFEDLDASPLPPRPKRRGGKTKLDHHRGPQSDRWYWKIGGLEYAAVWAHPDRWYATPPEPVTDPGVVRVSAQRREPGRLRGEPIELPVTEFPVSGPVCWPEEVHNQVRVIVEARTYLPATAA
ncbi:DUF3560 domain-containing protein [Nocardia anaemiae]|uniref:DUF3560 domain-containing protein n=1 Tax=Nocardia anaemiae TaxID=263910 RepID=UPI0012F5032F|nr:DUF3560 domain-containing protein [Nocardia anaemiae]